MFECDENFMTDRGKISHDFLTTVKTGNNIFVLLHRKEGYSFRLQQDSVVGNMTVLSENTESDTCEVEGGSSDEEVSTCNCVCSTPISHGVPKHDCLLEMFGITKRGVV